MNLRFWCNTLLDAVVPGGIGYRRSLRWHKNANYSHERDKASIRKKHFAKEGWKKAASSDDLVYRDYGTYEEYVEHQKSKFEEIIQIHGGFDTKTTIKYRLQFYDRFGGLNRYLNSDARVLCAGARQGTEVQVLHELGYTNAYGIDLNPGPQNPLVKKGDFLKIDEPAGVLDLVYSNAIDHAFNLEDLFREHARVIKPDGYVFYDIALQEGGVFEAVHWKADEVVFQLMLKFFSSVEMVRVDGARRWKSVLLKGKRS